MSGGEYTTTPNYALIKPNPGGDDGAWAGHLNSNADTLDALIHGIDTRPAGGGTVTSVTAGTGLTGGSITTAGTIAASFGTVAGTIAQGNDSRFATIPAASSTLPLIEGTAAIGTATTYARADHVHPSFGGTGGGVTVSDTPPPAPSNGSLWFDSANVSLLVYEFDGTSSQWTVANNQNVQPTVTVADAAPPVKQGALWYDSVGLGLFLGFNDGSSTQWVAANAQNALLEAPLDGSIYARRGSTSSWVQAAPAAALNAVGRNLLHNSQMAVAQRGAGPFTTISGAYTLDRWYMVAALDTMSIRQFAVSDTDRAGIGDESAKWMLANSFTGNAGATAYQEIQQRIEDVQRLSGKTVTLSFWAVASAALKLGLNMTQQFGSGGSPSAPVHALAAGLSVTLSGTWARYSMNIVIPSIAGKTLGTNGDSYTMFRIGYSSGSNNNTFFGNIGVQSGSVNIWGVQLEIGSVATQLEKLEYADDLRHCQRFYQTGYLNLLGYNVGGQQLAYSVPFAVTMRAAPTMGTAAGFSQTNCSSTSMPGPTAASVTLGTTVTTTGSAQVSCTYTASADL